MTRAYAEALMVVLATSPADVRTRFDGILIPSDVWRDFGVSTAILAANSVCFDGALDILRQHGVR